MSKFMSKTSQIPAFGEWNCYVDGFTVAHYFKSAKDHDLYCSTGDDLYYCDDQMKETKKEEKWAFDKEEGCGPWGIRGQEAAFTRPPKPVDEDLYKIPPHQLHSPSIRKKILGLFSRCLEPSCDEE
ncbi:hypothetical protein Sjap_009181 [Stephania japonica]|uniref:Uncharacterized protein n=1 Tax=Stephania japonica TaxID=461633 RepID=A0AAP0JTC0_9MAGN